MAIEIPSGFFDSTQEAPRLYTAEEFSSIFDGLISDGVYANYHGTNMTPFQVTAPTSGYNVNVGKGRGWFHHVWVVNDNTLSITIDTPHTTYPRTDTIYIKVDKFNRKSYIDVSKGTPSATADPTIPNDNVENGVYYYPIAYVKVPANVGRSEYFIITSTIGNGKKTPWVRTIVEEPISLESYLAEFQQQITTDVAAWEANIVEQLDEDTPVYDHGIVANLRERVETLEETSGTAADIDSKINAFNSNTVAPIKNNVNTLLSYLNPGFKRYTGQDKFKGSKVNINNPPQTICRMIIDGANKVAGTVPSVKYMGTGIWLFTMVADSSAQYNVQFAVGLSYRMALRYKHGGKWDTWRYLEFKA